MAEFGKEIPTNDEDQVAIVNGPGSVPGEAGALAPSSTRAHYPNPLGGFSGETAGAEEVGGPFDDGDASKSFDVGVGGGCGMAMEKIQGAVDQLTKGQALITEPFPGAPARPMTPIYLSVWGYGLRGALRGTPGSAYPQPGPNETSCPVAPQAARSW